MDVDANLARAIRGPVTLITLGVLFTLDHFTPYSFHQTWPVLLIVFGLLSLLRRGATRPQGPPPYNSPWPPPPGPPPWGPGPPPGPMGGGSSGGGYRQSPYGGSGPTGAGTGSRGGSR
ncbi:MAG TPA: DUF5668 domain-containing protein [Bryobacteraceae bacterium]|nr:DUF5668 domain-containing protein [Bryobacteraceae bacterium]